MSGVEYFLVRGQAIALVYANLSKWKDVDNDNYLRSS